MTGPSLEARRVRLRLLYHLAVLGPLGLATALAPLAQVEGLATAASMLALLHLLVARLAAPVRLLERAVLKEQACPACNYRIPLRNWWRCPCGFVGFRERHVLAPCRNCGREFAWLTCPHCEVQIPL